MNSVTNTPRPLEMFWFLPTGGDGRYLGSKTGQRTIDHAYLTAIAPRGRDSRLHRRADPDRARVRRRVDGRRDRGADDGAAKNSWWRCGRE